MLSRTSDFRVLGAVLLMMLVMFIGCGGDDGPTKTSGGDKDGRVYMRNDTDRTIEVSYLNEDGQVITTEVPPNAVNADVSQTVLDGGSNVKFTVAPVTTGEDSGGRGGSQEFDVEVEIDGSRTIWVKKISLQGVGQPEWELI